VSDDGRLFAIGDVHGCAVELETLVDGLPLAPGDTICFVGDYIDRGQDSRAVIELVLALRERADVTTVCLKGNHEDMCLGYLGRAGRWGEAWMQNGGTAAVRSYGLAPRAAPAAVEEAMGAHVAFLESLERTFVWNGWRCVHAGVHPDRSWDEQRDEDLLWIRDEFLSRPHALPETIVFGHTPNREVLVDLPYKIGIDTGCVYGGCLTALELGERVVHQVRAGERKVRTAALPERRRAR
jgi:serine/threonine protein phosphatase 1